MITYTPKMVSLVGKYVLPTMKMGKYLLPIKLAIWRLWVNGQFTQGKGVKKESIGPRFIRIVVVSSATSQDCG